MKQEDIIHSLAKLGELMVFLGEDNTWINFDLGVTKDEYAELNLVVNKQKSYNGWFTNENVRQSLIALGTKMTVNNLTKWAQSYSFSSRPKNVAIIMAGNIPLVGFHDFLCALISGHHAVCKLSSDDKTLLPALGKHLINFNPELNQRVIFTTGKLTDIEAVIATGSNNSLKYFEQYFGKYPHLFRSNRTSIAVLTGEESNEELEQLGHDIFSYYGLGCRNVSQILIPKEYDLNRFFEGIFSHSNVINNNKYGNNYDYNKAVYLMNKESLLDNNFVLLRESDLLFSPLGMIHYHYYESMDDVNDYIKINKENIQVVVGKAFLPFGKAQSPELTDYADGVDTMKWLSELN